MKTGQKIAALRTKAGLTQEELASELFVSRDLVSKWETGKSPPNYKMILKLTRLFGVEVEEIFDKERLLEKELAACVPAGLHVSEKDLKEALSGFLSVLSVRDRSVFLRRYFYLEDPFDIAEEYGISAGYVRTILMRTRKKLKKYLKGAFS